MRHAKNKIMAAAQKARAAAQVAGLKKMVSDFLGEAAKEIEAGNFAKEWLNPNGAYVFARRPAINFATNKKYSARNSLLLNRQDIAGRPAAWVGFSQIKALGGRVRKGAKSAKIVKPLIVKEEEEKEEKTNEFDEGKCVGFKVENIFNILDIEGLPEKFRPLLEKKSADTMPEQLTFFTITGVDLLDAWSEAIPAEIKVSLEHLNYYNRGKDFVHIEPADTFVSDAERVHTIFHELAHWTGGAARLNRAVKGSKGYAREELVAELSADIICESAGVSGFRSNSFNYLNGYVKDYGKTAAASFTDVLQDVFKATEMLFSFKPEPPTA